MYVVNSGQQGGGVGSCEDSEILSVYVSRICLFNANMYRFGIYIDLKNVLIGFRRMTEGDKIKMPHCLSQEGQFHNHTTRSSLGFLMSAHIFTGH